MGGEIVEWINVNMGRSGNGFPITAKRVDGGGSLVFRRDCFKVVDVLLKQVVIPRVQYCYACMHAWVVKSC